jgi:aminomethyltransferase
MIQLKQTPLNTLHRNLGARMVDFGGWDMPVQYAGILAEHEAVRTRAGLFDVSHMGEIRVKGPQAEAFLDWLTPNAVKRLAVGQIHYTAFLTDRGTFVDDLLLHKFSETEYLLVVNASNTDKDFEWVKSHADTWDVTVTNESSFTAQIAIQGPRALVAERQDGENDEPDRRRGVLVPVP